MVERHHWHNIAKDIILLSTLPRADASYGTDQIAREYGMTRDEFSCLMRDEEFSLLVKEEMASFKAQGPHAGYRMRMSAMAVTMMEQLYSEACGSDDIKFSEKLRLLDSLLKGAGLDEPPENKKGAIQTAVGVNVSFNIPKLDNPKLKHIEAVASV